MRNLKKFSRLISSVYILSVILGGSFTTVKAEVDNLPPEFVGIKVDKVVASVGEKINLKVIAKDNIGLTDKAHICYVKNDGKYNLEARYELSLVNGEYVAEIPADVKKAGDWKVSFIALSDKSNNSIIVYNNEIHDKYGVLGKDLDSGDYQISSSTFKTEITSVKVDKNVVVKGEKVNLNVEAKDIENLADDMEISYELQGNSICPEKKIMLKLQDKKFTGNINTSEFNGFGTWKIKSLKLKNKKGEVAVVYNDELCKEENVQKINMVNGTLNIQPNSNSTLSNDISIRVSKSEVKRGDSVIIEVKGEDSKYKFKDEAYLSLVNNVNGVEVERRFTIKRAADGIYGGMISISKNIPSGTWKVNFVVMENENDEANIVYNSNIHPINGKDFSEANFTVIEKNNNTALKYIAVNGNVIKDFKADKYQYTYEIEDTGIPIITAEAEDGNAVVQVVTPQAIDGEALINVTAENGVKATYKVKLVDEISDNIALKSISVNGKVIKGFRADKYEYTYEVEDLVIPVITAEAENANAVVEITTPQSINGEAVITVTGENGQKATYKVKLVDEISDSTALKSISVNGKVIKDFKADKYEYTYEVEDLAIPTITAEAEDKKAVVQVAPPLTINGEAIITVISEKGKKATYKVKLVDEIKNNAKLASITIDGNPLVGFNPNVYEYEYYVQSVNIPEVKAVAQYDGAKVQRTVPDSIPGEVKIKCEVAGETKEYTIKLKEAIKITVMNENLSFKNGEDAVVTVNALNQSNDTRDVVLVIGLFNDKDSLIVDRKLGIGNSKLEKKKDNILQATIGIPKEGKYKIKVFMWDSIKGMHIIKECIEFDVSK